MPSTDQSRARRWLRTVARGGADDIADLPVLDDEPYSWANDAAYHYLDHDSLWMEEHIWVDTAARTATLAVRWYADGDYDAGAYQGPEDEDDPHAGYGDVHLHCTGGVAQHHRYEVAAGIRAALDRYGEWTDCPWRPEDITPVV